MSNKKSSRVHVWDLPTRIFHWLLVTLIFCAWASYEFNEVFGDTSLLWHRMNGYAILVLVIWRLLWGVAGSADISICELSGLAMERGTLRP
jgi:cytochrome b